MKRQHIFSRCYPFQLESGKQIADYHLSYTTLGKMNAEKDNVVWVFHALTANSDPEEWWPELVGRNKLFDPNQYFIVCVNMPGSCYGSINPLDINPHSGEPYFHSFPFFTPRDMVRAYQPLKNHLGIEKIKIGIGGSMGGQQLLEWAIEEPLSFEYIFPIATNAFHSPWGIAFNAAQRLCIEADISWKEKKSHAGINGLKTARSIALLSYRHYNTYQHTQLDEDKEKTDLFKSESYQRYQGEKLAKRFNAFSYYFLSKSMDAHNVGRGRRSVENALSKIVANTAVIGINSDILFPVAEQKFIAQHIPNAHLYTIDSLYGHDGFLLEYEKIQKIVTDTLAKKMPKDLISKELTVG